MPWLTMSREYYSTLYGLDHMCCFGQWNVSRYNLYHVCQRFCMYSYSLVCSLALLSFAVRITWAK